MGCAAEVELRPDVAVCVCGAQSGLLLSRFLGSRVAMRDEITFAAPTGDRFSTEILITKHALSGRNYYFYQAPIGYVTQRKPDKRNEPFVSAEVRAGALGIGVIFVPCEVLREYFYGLSDCVDGAGHPAVYSKVGRAKAPSRCCSCRVEDLSRELADFKLPLGILGFARHPGDGVRQPPHAVTCGHVHRVR